jgi:hypothetical protein
MITIAVNRAALRHHPFKYLLNIAANCRRAKAYGRSPKNMRRYCERKAVVEAEGRPPLQALDHMATVFYSAVDNSRSSASDGLERSRRRTCAFALFS